MKKIAAFTLMELLIGMIISSIVISFGYMAYNLIYDGFLNFKKVKATMMETNQLNTTFGNDVRNAEIISSNENKLILFNKNEQELRYEFLPDYVLRTHGELTDTFKVATHNIQQHFLFPENNMFLQQFSFDATVLNEPESFQYSKSYSSETLMNYNIFTKANP